MQKEPASTLLETHSIESPRQRGRKGREKLCLHRIGIYMFQGELKFGEILNRPREFSKFNSPYGGRIKISQKFKTTLERFEISLVRFSIFSGIRVSVNGIQGKNRMMLDIFIQVYILTSFVIWMATTTTTDVFHEGFLHRPDLQ